MPKKLTDTQLVLLSHAAMQHNGALLPVPKSIRLNAGALTTVLRSLLKQELVFERPAERDEVTWRQEETGERYMLTISSEGRVAIGVDPIGTTPSGTKTKRVEKAKRAKVLPAKVGPTPGAKLPRPGTKLASLIAALEATGGATIDDLMTATEWQAHSVRGAISGALKKTFGLDVTSSKVAGGRRVYAIASEGCGK